MTIKKTGYGYRWLNNIKVRNKLVMIYILCIVVPVLATNIIFADRIINSVKRENLDQYNGIMDTVQINIGKEFENIIYLSTLIYTDRSLDRALEQDYTNVSDRLDVYNYFNGYMARIRSMYTQIDNVSIYIDNGTIPYGGYNLINNVQLDTLDWYKALKPAGKTVVFYTYTQNGVKYLSVIRNLNYFFDSKTQKIVKIDLNFTDLTGYLKNRAGKWDAYLVNSNDEILVSSNDDINKQSSFIPFSTVSAGASDTLITRDLGKYNVLRGWKVVGVFKQEQLFESLRQSGIFVAVMALLNLFVATVFILLISRSLNMRLKLISSQMKLHTLELLPVEEGTDEIGEVIREYNLMTKKIQDMIKNEYEYSIHMKTAELERQQAIINALQSQINPHFLFNTLETIRMRSCLKNEDETAGIIKSLSKMFRRMLVWKEDLIPLAEEISFVVDYLRIQSYRFGDKIGYQIDISTDAGNIKIPKMTIQPFVENSCIHGLESISKGGKILVKADVSSGMLRIWIEDNGRGMEKKELDCLLSQLGAIEEGSGSIGVRNVYNRLLLTYSRGLGFSIFSEPGLGTSVTISIPVQSGQED